MKSEITVARSLTSLRSSNKPSLKSEQSLLSSASGETKTEVSLVYEFAQKYYFDVKFKETKGPAKHAIEITVESRQESKFK